ncbi:multidrug effflux MFS transporter [Azospirillum sp. SYSU D00513]|uniref:multidrug effflux MFS transporter n=1 Tax=Azospirillum sp. SYSU D00513 TaxID=2812561 RepID=UPI001FFE5629|nr:multidrug effflux MFS transporter [Azospirillum sp. SYSU D00513]
MSALPSKPPVWLLVAATATGPLALNMFVPSMPRLPAVFDTGYAMVQLTLSLFLIGVAVGQLAYGPLSDRFGRRPVLLGGVALYVVASLACALAPSIGFLVAGRVAQALGGCAGMVIGRAVVRDAWGRDEATRVLAMVIAGMAVAPMLGPALGGVLDDWIGWRAGFVFTVGFGLLVLLAGFRSLPETNRQPVPIPSPAALWGIYRTLLGKPVFLGFALVAALNTAGFFAFLAGAPFIMVDMLGRSASEYGIVFILLSVGYMAGNLLVSRLAGRWRGERLMLIGLVLSLTGPAVMLALLLAGVFTPLALFLPATVMCLGNGLVMPTSMSAAIGVEPRLAGTASGLLGFCQMGMGAAVSATVGAMKDGEPFVMAVAMVLINTLAFAAYRFARRGAMRPVPAESAA